LTNIIAGNVQFVFSSVSSAVALIKANRLTALAVSTKSRSPALPEVATMAESGMPGFDFSVWYGLLAPAGTPKAIKDKLAKEVGRILALQDVKDRLLTLGATPRPGTPEEFDQLVRSDVARMAKLIRDVGIPTE
jgi:tripartite-type tricarboxylate transporter receptor subunit TctC